MITLLRNTECYCPQYAGKKDILLAGSKIYKIQDPGYFTDTNLLTSVDCDGLKAFPGLIDGHVHITGGGGEDGFTSRIGEINIEDILNAGITTAVGLLGADNQTKSLKGLYAKAKSLEIQGITTYIYSGSYEVPVVTFTGDITSDMILIDKVIGAGEIALSDHRSSYPDIRDLLELSAKVHMGSLLSGKKGLVHIHLGDGKSQFDLINKITDESDLPIDLFLPTHVNRNTDLFNEALNFVRKGGNIDLTSGESSGITIPDAIEEMLNKNTDLSRITISSDANGSIPDGGIGRIGTLYEDIVDCIFQKNISPEVIFPLVTGNVAKRIGLYPQKGILKEESDADILLTDGNYKVRKLFSQGILKMSDGKLLKDK